MDNDLKQNIIKRLKEAFGLKEAGTFLRLGKCPSCNQKELYVPSAMPWHVRCGRLDKCGHEFTVKEAFPDLFDNWSKRHPQTNQNPHAAADAYLRDGRGLNIARLSGAYTQEFYQDRSSGAASATVRFPLGPKEDGGWWERLIDGVHRFGKKKANFKYGFSYRGHVWHNPKTSMADYAGASEIWFAEGIFDAAALGEAFAHHRPHALAVSTMSTNNYPSNFLAELAHSVGAGRRPTLIFAFDQGPAGINFTRQWVKQARSEGWMARAAQVMADGEGTKQDWNDLLQAQKLKAEDIAEYLTNGDITIAESARDKAFLLWRRHRRGGFPLTFNGSTFWANVPTGKLNAKIAETSDEASIEGPPSAERIEKAVEDVIEVQTIANCTFRALYFQRDLDTDDNSYFLSVTFPGKKAMVKANFTGSTLAAGTDFKKRLLSVAPGAIYTGDTSHLDAIMRQQLTDIKTVEALHFTGYSPEHGAYILGDIAVHGGKVIERNGEDYFDIAKSGLKLRGASPLKAINWQPDLKPEARFHWWRDFHTAFGARGTVCLAFVFVSLFAEQVRATQKSLGFLEMSGDPGTGKSTILMFLWKLLGRDDGYEGFDPAKATGAAIARNMARVSNLPVVMIEGDRTQDQPHSRRFDWDELKSLYNGQSSRARGVANGGLETFEPPFRGAMVISQNRPIEADTAVLERIMSLNFDKVGWSMATKAAAERIEQVKTEDVSGWIIDMIRAEADTMKRFLEAFSYHDKRLTAHHEVRNGRLAKNHAQLAAALDCMAHQMGVITKEQLAQTHGLITKMCVARHGVIDADSPAIKHFWDIFDFLNSKIHDEVDPLNNSRRADTIAINLQKFEALATRENIRLPMPMLELRKHLHTSKTRRFLRVGTVNNINGKSVHCWQFQNPTPTASQFDGGFSINEEDDNNDF